MRFAHVPYPESSLVAGGAKARTVDIAFTFWVARSASRLVLIDAGFYRERFIEAWKPQDYGQPAEALKAGLGIAPDEVTDLVRTHVHWDHADGAAAFPRARIWGQREEYEHYVGANGEALDRAVDPDVAKMLAQLKAAGRVTLIDGDAREILPGIRVYTGGRHTMASQFLGVQTRDGTGHDPAVFERFPKPGRGVAKIE